MSLWDVGKCNIFCLIGHISPAKTIIEFVYLSISKASRSLFFPTKKFQFKEKCLLDAVSFPCDLSNDVSIGISTKRIKPQETKKDNIVGS